LPVGIFYAWPRSGAGNLALIIVFEHQQQVAQNLHVSTLSQTTCYEHSAYVSERLEAVNKFLVGLAAATGMAAALMSARPASAIPTPPCLASPTCSLDSQTFTTTGGSSGFGLTFLASFTTPNQSTSGIATLVDDYLALLGYHNVTYLGRQDGNGTIGGDSITVTGDQSGTWTFNPGTTGDVGAFVAIHAGNGQNDELFKIDLPGLSGTWGTLNGHDLSNFDLFGTPAVTGAVPEPASLALLGTSLLGLAFIRRRKSQN
jgi:hypothetical protein